MKYALRQVKYAVAYEVRFAYEVCFAHGGKFYFMSAGPEIPNLLESEFEISVQIYGSSRQLSFKLQDFKFN